jgi:hypothetical protein
MEFTATEFGFEDGLGGASNGADTKDYHYILFGRQTDNQHPECDGVYFEFDDQSHGSVDSVTGVVIADDVVEFELKDDPKIVVRRGMSEPQWSGFVRGIYGVFRDDIVHKA